MTATIAPARKTAPKRTAVIAPAKAIDHGLIHGVGEYNDRKGGHTLQHLTFEGHHADFGVGAKVYRLCWKCDGSDGWGGRLSYHLSVYGGVCFACNGSGFTSIYADTIEQAAIKAARDIAADERREARRLAQAEADRIKRDAEFTAWLGMNKAFVVTLAKFIKTNKLAKTITKDNGYTVDSHKDDVALIEFAEDIMAKRTLTDKQAEFVSDLMVRVAARKAAGAATRYAADVDAKITFTGKVTHSINLEPVDVGYGNKSYRHMVVLDGTGEWSGCTFKWIGTSTLAWELEVDTEYKLSATVKKHDVYNDIKQTVLTRTRLAK